MTRRINANLLQLTAPALLEKSERYESFRDGGGGMVSKADVICHHVQLTANDQTLSIEAQRDGAFVEATCRALNLPEEWMDYGCLKSCVRAIDERIKVEMSLLGARNRIIQQVWIEPNEEHCFEFNLLDLPLIAGRRPPYQPTGLLLKVQWGSTWNSDGELLIAGGQWSPTDQNRPVKLEWSKTELLPRDPDVSRAVVDTFGQRILGVWPEKVSDQKHFEEIKRLENEWLEKTALPQNRSRFGGDTSLPEFESSGFFRVEQRDGRWWFVDPDGYAFWSVGTTGIRVSDTTMLEGCESFFKELPDRNGPYAKFYDPPIGSPANDGKGKEVVSFYLLNVLKKYGSLENWRDQVVRRFKAWGYNTFGNWSDEIMLDQKEIPHTRALTTDVGPMVTKAMADVFDPAWELAFDEHCQALASPNRDNPWLLGYFVDNEKHWTGFHLKCLSSGANSAFRQELIRFAKSNLGESIETLGKMLNQTFEDWDSLSTTTIAVLKPTPEGEDFMREFVGHYAEHYFEKVSRVLKKHDPNHLYMGCRFVRKKPDDRICIAAGKYCDVVTVNCYSLLPERKEFGQWFQATGRPIQIGEHHLPLRGERQLPPLYPAFTSAERRVSYERFLREWAEQPYSLGAHWFQHTDQNATGRPVDGENQTVGFVDITDQPHPELVEAAMAVSRKMYEWHNASST